MRPVFAAVAAICCSISAPAFAQNVQNVITFSELERSAKDAGLKPPAGVETLRLCTGPTDIPGEAVTMHFYHTPAANFVDIYTSKNNGQPIMRNHIRLTGAYMAQPKQSTITLRRFMPLRKVGWFLIASGESYDLTFAFPKGFGGPVYQQEFLRNNTGDVQRHYTFTDADSRGFLIVKAAVDSTGATAPDSDVAFYVWDGKRFVRRTKRPGEP